MPLKGKKIFLGITGSIAAYKTPILVRSLISAGADVEVIMTECAKDFVTPLSLSTVSTHPIHCTPFNPENGAWDSHVAMGANADLLLIAPVSANTIAKMAHGIADNLLLTTYLAAKCPVIFAPAMDLDMYKHQITQENIKTLLERGHQIIEPQSGYLASGLVGCGRMEEPHAITQKVTDFFFQQQRFNKKTVIVSAGPTYENIDPVRFIGNYSSGKMGLYIAEAFAEQGATVHLVAGPGTPPSRHPKIIRHNIVSAQEMFDTIVPLFPHCNIAIMASAVADYRIKTPSASKIKKSAEELTLNLTKNPDILQYLGNNKTNQLVVGFALETDDYEKNAIEKLEAKNADLIFLNAANVEGCGFDSDTNQITAFNALKKKTVFSQKRKQEVAQDIIDYIYTQFQH